MVTLFVRHKVKDFTEWKAAYDAFDSERKSMGVTGDGVYQAEGNPNDITLYHHFGTLDAAKSFMSSPRLKEVMKEAGVEGTPDIWFTKKA
jgi:hypothetical protein